MNNNFDEVFFPQKPIIRDVNTESFLRNSKNDNSKKNTNDRLANYGNHAPGRGLGNLESNNFIHFGENSRNDKKKFDNKLEQSIDCRFDYLFDNKKQMAFANYDSQINGSSTRKQNLSSESVFNHNRLDMTELKQKNPYENTQIPEKPKISKSIEKKVQTKPTVNKQLKKKFTFNY